MKTLVWLVALSALALAGGSALQSSEPELELVRAHVETADVLDQMEPDTGERDLYAADAATLHRTPNGISVKINMPTPEPGTYRYPEPDGPTVAPPGHPKCSRCGCSSSTPMPMLLKVGRGRARSTAPGTPSVGRTSP